MGQPLLIGFVFFFFNFLFHVSWNNKTRISVLFAPPTPLPRDSNITGKCHPQKVKSDCRSCHKAQAASKAVDTYFSEENMNYTIKRTQRSHLSMRQIFLLSSVLNNNLYNLSGLKESLVSFYTPIMQQSGGLCQTLFQVHKALSRGHITFSLADHGI